PPDAPAPPDDLGGGRRSHLFRDVIRQEGAKGVAVAVVSTVVVFGLIGYVVVHSPNWPAVKHQFLNGKEFVSTFPDIARKFVNNIWYFLICEVVILVFALVLAVLRSLPGAVFFPLRLMSIVYTDVFRGIPTILVIYLLGFGVPALRIQGVPSSATFWALVALILSYSAYVAEVYRAGIESIHPSQIASARSLGLTRWQSMRFVILPQAVRRVIPPLLNDFIGLQKDSALIFFLGLVEGLGDANIISSGDFNFTPYVALSVIYIAITIPQARFVDRLIARDQRRRQAGGDL